MWPFKRRRQERIDQVGEATVYPHHGGAFASEQAATDGPAWDGPTLLTTVAPLLTPGGIQRAGQIRQASGQR